MSLHSFLQSPSRSNVMTRISVGETLQIVLMLWFGLPEGTRRSNLGNRLPRPQPRGVYVRDCFICDPPLLLTDIENRRTIARTDVVALAMFCGWIVNLKHELQQLTITRFCRIEDNLDRFGVCPVVAVGRVWRFNAGVADAR